MGDVIPSLAGPKRPQDRVVLSGMRDAFRSNFGEESGSATLTLDGQEESLDNGKVVIAAITSCTNTSNPSVMVGSGLLAKKAVERGLTRKPWVKTSMAPGSQVVTDYMDSAGLTSIPGRPWVPHRRLRLHHVHREQRPAA